MDWLGNTNIVTLVMAVLFAGPILTGIIWPLTPDRIRHSLFSLANSLLFLASILLSAWLTKHLLSDEAVLGWLYQRIPTLHSMMDRHAFWIYLGVFVAFSLLINALLHLITLPFYLFALKPVARVIGSIVGTLRGFSRRVVSVLWKLPRSLWLVLLFTILLNLYTSYFNSPLITRYARQSEPYQLVQQRVVQPLLNNSAVQKIKVLFNDSFSIAENDEPQVAEKHLIRYFNGMTLSDAIQSNDAIDTAAREIVGGETDDRQKAYLIYLWICENIRYDNDKAAIIAQNPSRVSSGAVAAYTTRSGICFDFACLYVAMCREVGVKVRFLTGLGFTGDEWGDHAWNQAYDSSEDVWVNVDTTFGSTGANYFDTPHFNLDHFNGVVQGEWPSRAYIP